MTRKRCRCFVNCRNFVAKLAGIEVHLDPDVQARLARIAAERGRDPEALAKEALEKFVNCNSRCAYPARSAAMAVTVVVTF